MAETEEYLALKQLTDVLDDLKIDYAIGGSIVSLLILGEALWGLRKAQIFHERFMLISYA